MFREFGVEALVVGTDVTFVFARSVSILTLAVGEADVGPIWEFVASEFEPVLEGTDASMVEIWPLDEAPPEALELMRVAQAQADRRLEEFGPSKPPIQSVRYGEVPEGYKSDSPAKKLVAGRYYVIAFAEQGHGRAEFSIGAT